MIKSEYLFAHYANTSKLSDGTSRLIPFSSMAKIGGLFNIRLTLIAITAEINSNDLHQWKSLPSKTRVVKINIAISLNLHTLEEDIQQETPRLEGISLPVSMFILYVLLWSDDVEGGLHCSRRQGVSWTTNSTSNIDSRYFLVSLVASDRTWSVIFFCTSISVVARNESPGTSSAKNSKQS